MKTIQSTELKKTYISKHIIDDMGDTTERASKFEQALQTVTKEGNLSFTEADKVARLLNCKLLGFEVESFFNAVELKLDSKPSPLSMLDKISGLGKGKPRSCAQVSKKNSVAPTSHVYDDKQKAF